MIINTEEIFKRMDLQQIRAFILDGLDTAEIYNCTYSERLNKGNELITERLKSIYRDENEFSDAMEEFYNAQTVNSEIYTEIGIKAGARLMFQLLYQNDN